MTHEEYRKTLDAARVELEVLMVRQADTEQRIARLKQLILALSPLAEEPQGLLYSGFREMMASMGITDACREIFKATGVPMAPLGIKAKLIAMGIDLSGHKNIMATIHSTLKRLAENDEIFTNDNGLTYEWKWHGIPTLAPPPKLTHSMQPNRPWEPMKK